MAIAAQRLMIRRIMLPFRSNAYRHNMIHHARCRHSSCCQAHHTERIAAQMTRSFLLVYVAVAATRCCAAPLLLTALVIDSVLLASAVVYQLWTAALCTRSLRLSWHLKCVAGLTPACSRCSWTPCPECDLTRPCSGPTDLMVTRPCLPTTAIFVTLVCTLWCECLRPARYGVVCWPRPSREEEVHAQSSMWWNWNTQRSAKPPS